MSAESEPNEPEKTRCQEKGRTGMILLVLLILAVGSGIGASYFIPENEAGKENPVCPG